VNKVMVGEVATMGDRKTATPRPKAYKVLISCYAIAAWSSIVVAVLAILTQSNSSNRGFFIPTYIINMKARPDRLASILVRVQTQPAPEIIEAVDGRTLKPSATQLTRGEIGCFKSHLLALQKIAESTQPYGLVLEDDAVIQLPKSFDALRLVMEQAPPDWGALSLGCNYFPRKQPSAVQVSKRIYSLNGSNILGTHAILWKREAAQARLSEVTDPMFDFWLPWDLWLSVPRSGMQLYVVHPPMAIPANFDPLNPFADSATQSIR
jgi:hypothetical protein